MSFYSPFIGFKENFLPFTKVSRRHLVQLTGSVEGYKLEFKGNLNMDVQNKLPKIISSFANSAGGWLIIGIEDKSKAVSPIPKISGDYRQIIKQIIKSKVSPLPEYEIKFISTKEGFGVLIIYVYEGNFTPYIADGRIYVRNGSSSEPISVARQSSIQLLQEKSDDFMDNLGEFFVRNINLPTDDAKCPILNIYLKSVSEKNFLCDGFLASKESIIEQVLLDSKNYVKYQQNSNSIIFQSSKAVGDECSVVFEIYDDLSSKIHIPLIFGSDNKDEATFKLIEVGALKDGSTNLFDGNKTIDSIRNILNMLLRVLDYFDCELYNFALCIQIENAENSGMYFNSDKFLEFTKKYGLYTNTAIIYKSSIKLLREFPSLFEDDIDSSIWIMLGNAYGYNIAQFFSFFK